MATVHDALSRQFYAWEVRGRGWRVYPEPVRPEPPFRSFDSEPIPQSNALDDGRRPTFLSSLFKSLVGHREELQTILPVEADEPEPERFRHLDLVEMRATLPVNLNITREACAEFLASLSQSQFPIAFEIVGTHGEVALQFVSDRDDSSLILRQLESHFPDGVFAPTDGRLLHDWEGSPCDEALVIEFGLAREFMFQLRTEKADPFIGIIGALSKLAEDEIALFQVVFEPVRENWKESIEASLLHSDGKPFFVNGAEIASAAKWKAMQRLYAAVVRIGVLAESFDRTKSIARDIAGALSVFSNAQGNELIPLTNDDYPFDDHIEDLLWRNSRRTGMILTTEELVGFVHLPSSSVRSPFLSRDSRKTRAAPASNRTSQGLLLGLNEHAGKICEVRITAEERVRHMHLLGASGTGKSTLLFNLIRQDIESSQGLAVLDPHGDLIEKVLGIIPEDRIGDVILIDPSDEEYSVGFNILSAHSDLEKNLLASDLVAVFARLSTSWGDQMGSVLRNAILAFLESERGGSLSDLRRFLIEPPFRQEFLDTVRDPDIVYYWRKAFPQLAGNKSIGSVLTRLETFLAPKPIRYMVAQKKNRLNFSEIMDAGKIFLAKLPRGEMGEENSFLLGSFFVSKFQQAAMARQRQEQSIRRDFWLYLDEFHNFITPSMAEVLSGARKYRLGLILAHQDLGQLQGDRKVASAVLSNPYTRIIFRVGDGDARALESGLSFFEAKDLQNLEVGQAICRIEKANGDFNLGVIKPNESKGDEKNRRHAVVEASRNSYGTPRAKIEGEVVWKSPKDENPPIEPSITRNTAAKVEVNAIVPEKQASVPSPEVSSTGKTSSHLKPEIVLSPEAKAALAKRDAISSELEGPRPESDGPRNLGKGGARHKIIQKRIKEAAETIAFRATIEGPVPNSKGQFDILLERADLTIACEISFTTSVDHEIGNVQKCLIAGIGNIAVICLEQSRLKKIEQGVKGTFSPSDAARVMYFEPAAFIDHLKTLAIPSSQKLKEPKVRGGRSIKRTQSAVSPEQRQAREAEYNRAVAEALKKKKK